MSKTSVKQIFVLILSSVFLTFVVLELLLRLGGFLFKSRQEMSNRATFTGDEIRILCIGESTTALGNDNSYPSILEEILNKQTDGRTYKVINKGLVSKTSRDILDQLDENLNRYKPAFVVSMIGINDTKETPGFFSKGKWDSFLSQLRVHHLFVLLSQHLNQRKAQDRPSGAVTAESKTALTPSQEDKVEEKDYPKIVQNIAQVERVLEELEKRLAAPGDLEGRDLMVNQVVSLQRIRAQNYRLVGIYHHMRSNYGMAEQALAQSYRLAPQDPATLLEIGRLLRAQKRFAESGAMLTSAQALAPTESRILLELARLLSDAGKVEPAHKVFNQILSFKPDNVWIWVEIGTWFKEHGFLDDALTALSTANDMERMDYITAESLAEVCDQLGKTEKAVEVRKNIEYWKNRMLKYSPETMTNYNEIVRQSLAAGARVIVMQYPLRRIEPLKALFSHPDSLTFIENRSMFLDALKNGDFSRFFADNFAGDFGHCTAEGNRLIASQLAGEIKRMVGTVPQILPVRN